MKKHRPGLLLLIIVVCLSFTIPSATMAAETIKIGALFDFTGPAADLGPRFKHGLDLALEEAHYQVAGRPLKVIVEDSGTDSAVTLDKLKKLVESDGINAIIGPLMVDAALAISPYASKHKVLMATLFNGAFELTKYGNWIIYPTTNTAQTIPLGYYAYDELGYRTMVIVGSDDADGHSFMRGVDLAFKERGGKIVQSVWVPSGSLDFSSYISIFKKADCIAFFFPNTTEVVRFITQCWEFGVKPPLLGTTVEGDMPSPVLKEIGDKILGMKGQEAYVSTTDSPLNKEGSSPD